MHSPGRQASKSPPLVPVRLPLCRSAAPPRSRPCPPLHRPALTPHAKCNSGSDLLCTTINAAHANRTVGGPLAPRVCLPACYGLAAGLTYPFSTTAPSFGVRLLVGLLRVAAGLPCARHVHSACNGRT